MPILRCLPFTLLMLVLVGCAGFFGDSYIGTTSDEVHQAAGYSIQLLIEGELQRVITSLFFTAGGWRFYSSMAMLALAVGYAEMTCGTMRTTVTFLGIHVATLLVLAVAVLSFHAFAPTLRSHLLLHVQDVGPSAGYYGCLGFAVAITLVNPSTRIKVISTILFVLLTRAFYSFTNLPEEGRVLQADLAHLIAFPLGIASGYLPVPYKRSSWIFDANPITRNVGDDPTTIE